MQKRKEVQERKHELSYYRSFPYSYEVIPTEDGGLVARYPDLPGCIFQGESLTEVLAGIEEGRELWMSAKLRAGEAIPEPSTAEPSGRLMLRVPIRLHADLARLAATYGKSLNSFINEILFNYSNSLPPEHGLSKRGKGMDGRSGESAPYYRYLLTPDPEGGFLAEHPDLPGCLSAGDTPAEAMAELDEARELWIEGVRALGFPIPEPLSATHSGVIHLRMKPDLHADLARNARRNGTTLNQILGFALAEAVGKLMARRDPVQTKGAGKPSADRELDRPATTNLKDFLAGPRVGQRFILSKEQIDDHLAAERESWE